MADPVTNGEAEEELVDYEEEEVADEGKAAGKAGEQAKVGYVGIHSSGFKDFLLKPELLRAIVDCGFEHPSEGALPCLLTASPGPDGLSGASCRALLPPAAPPPACNARVAPARELISVWGLLGTRGRSGPAAPAVGTEKTELLLDAGGAPEAA